MGRKDLTFRVFVSSTFADLQDERNALQEHVFPRLREYVFRRGGRFQAIDLRWGVSEEAAQNQQTMSICLQELERSQVISPRPNFIVLLGDRYGWRPLPSRIPAEEFDALLPHIPALQQTLVQLWYRVDENAVPAEYRLLPQREEERQRWSEQVEPELRQLLLAAVRQAFPEPSDPRRRRYEDSATHQEIRHGLLDVEDSAEHVFCYFRQIIGLPEGEEAGCYRDLLNGQPDREAQARLEDLKAELRDNLPAAHVHDYSATWECGRPRSDLPALCRRVEQDLLSIIAAELDVFETVSEMDREIEAHREFGEQRARFFLGRQDVLERIRQYLAAGGCRPLIVHGPSGVGKTAVLARAADRTGAVQRFVGATPASSSLRTLLAGLNRQIGGVTALATGDLRELKESFRRFLTAASGRPLTLFLDALDQLGPEDDAWTLDWLPDQLPPHVRLVLSVLDREDEAGACARAAQAKWSTGCFLPLQPLVAAEGSALLDTWLRQVGRRLQSEQLAYVQERAAECGLPLYITLVFEEVRMWKSADGIPRLAGDADGIIVELLHRLEQPEAHGQALVARALGYLAAARHGLTEDELLDVLSADPDVMEAFLRRSPSSPNTDRLPPVVWSRLHSDLKPFLVERSFDQISLLSFYHRLMAEVVARRYLAGDQKPQSHRALAAYFRGQPLAHEQDGLRQPNLRCLAELLHHLIESGQVRDAADLLADSTYVSLLVQVGRLGELSDGYLRAFEQAAAGQELALCVRLGRERLRLDERLSGDLQSLAVTAAEQGHAGYPRLRALFKGRPAADLLLSVEIACLAELRRARTGSPELARSTAEFLQNAPAPQVPGPRAIRNAAPQLPGPLALLLLEHQGPRDRTLAQHFQLGDFSVEGQVDYYLSLAPAVRSRRANAALAYKLKDLFWQSFDRGGFSSGSLRDRFYHLGPRPFRRELVDLTIAGLHVERQAWVDLCEALPGGNSTWALDRMHLVLTWVNRRIASWVEIERPREYHRVLRELSRRWTDSRQQAARGARVAVELAQLARRLAPRSGLAETIEADFIHRIARSAQARHRAFIRANQAELEHLKGNTAERDRLMAQAAEEGQSAIDVLGLLARLTARFYDTGAALPLINTLLARKGQYEPVRGEIAWWLFRLRLLEDAMDRPGVPWESWCDRLRALVSDLDRTAGSLNAWMPVYAVLFAVTAGRFFPRLVGLDPRRLRGAVEVCRRGVGLTDDHQRLVEDYLNGEVDGQTYAPGVPLQKLAWTARALQTARHDLDFVQDFFRFDHLPDELIPLPLAAIASSRDGGGPWVGCLGWEVQTEDEVARQVERWDQRLRRELAGRLATPAAAAGQGPDDTTACVALIEAHHSPRESLHQVKSTAQQVLAAHAAPTSKYLAALELFTLVLERLPPELRNPALLGAGLEQSLNSSFHAPLLVRLHLAVRGQFPIEEALRQPKLSQQLVAAWWRTCPHGPREQALLLRGIEKAWGRWWDWTPLSSGLADLLAELAAEGEVEVFEDLLATLPAPRAFRQGDDVLPGMARFLGELWRLEAATRRGLGWPLMMVQRSAAILEHLSPRTPSVVNTTYALPYRTFFRLLVQYPELERSLGGAHLLEEALTYFEANLDRDSRQFLAMEIARWLLASPRSEPPGWIARLARNSGYERADLSGRLAEEVLRADIQDHPPPAWLSGLNRSVITNLADDLADSWTGTRTVTVARALGWLVERCPSSEVLARGLPLAIRTGLPQAEIWATKLLGPHRVLGAEPQARMLLPALQAAVEVGQLAMASRLFRPLAAGTDAAGVGDLLAQLLRQGAAAPAMALAVALHSRRNLFALAVLALCVLEREEAPSG